MFCDKKAAKRIILCVCCDFISQAATRRYYFEAAYQYSRTKHYSMVMTSCWNVAVMWRNNCRCVAAMCSCHQPWALTWAIEPASLLLDLQHNQQSYILHLYEVITLVAIAIIIRKERLPCFCLEEEGAFQGKVLSSNHPLKGGISVSVLT